MIRSLTFIHFKREQIRFTYEKAPVQREWKNWRQQESQQERRERERWRRLEGQYQTSNNDDNDDDDNDDDDDDVGHDVCESQNNQKSQNQ